MTNNQQIPSVTSEVYSPDQLIAGNAKVITDTQVLVSGQNLVRGTLLGQIKLGAVTAAAKTGGNTGNGTFALDGTTPLLANAIAGVYTLRCILAGTNSATFRLTDPKGRVLGDYAFSGSGASVTVADQIKGVITDGGTDFIVGDGFDITVAVGSLKLTQHNASAIDGSQDPYAILTEAANASGGDVKCAIYRAGEFNANAMTFNTGVTAASVADALAVLGIYLKTPLSAAAPS